MSGISIVPIVVAAVANMVVGYLWYSPMVFGKTWMKLTGVKMGGDKKGAQSAYIWALIISLVEALVLQKFVGMAGASSYTSGAIVGFWAWLGFVVTTNAGEVIFEGRNSKVFQLNVGYNLVSFLIMGALLASMH